MKKFIFFSIVTIFFVSISQAFANNDVVVAVNPSHRITIEQVLLKNEAGQWIKVISPDRLVDFSQEEAKVSFFNNQGRVPQGKYVNFEIQYLDHQNHLKKIASMRDLDKPLSVLQGSYIFAAFYLKLIDPIDIESAKLLVDEDERIFKKNELLWT